MYLLFCLFSFVLANTVDTDLTQCDCGFQDNLMTTWSDVWHMNFENQPSPAKLHTIQDLFFANYIIGAKYNDSLSRVFRKENVNTLEDAIQIAVTVNQTDNQITCGGFGTTRQDFLYGSFRAYMKLTSVKGTVAGMFIYHSEGEIDIEVVSALRTPQAYFAVHPGLTEHGRASSLTHGNWNFSFDPTTDYHEYRFDWLPGLVTFYIDSVERYRMTTNILDKPGRFMFNHWTDSNANFSQGPVKENAFLFIKNMTFFFNSTESQPNCLKTLQTCSLQSIISDITNNLTTLERTVPSLTSSLPVTSPSSAIVSSSSVSMASAFIQKYHTSLWILPCLLTFAISS